jgi:hypothetical protein
MYQVTLVCSAWFAEFSFQSSKQCRQYWKLRSTTKEF